MANIPIHAKVVCTDGERGKSTHVILNPVNHKVTHIAIEDKHLPDNPTRLVPAGKVTEVNQQHIQLNCTKEEVANMSPFIVTNFIQESASGLAYQSGTAYNSRYVINDTAYDTVQVENIPADELALHSGMQVEANDGKLGKLDELVLDPKSGEITHLLMREGYLWGKKDVAIPASSVDYSDGKCIYLNIDSATVKALPAVPVKRL